MPLNGRQTYEKFYPVPLVVGSPRSCQAARKKPPPLDPEKAYEVVDSLLKYQYYVEEGIDKRYIAPLREAWLRHATRLVGQRARHLVSEYVYHETIIHVASEINEVYLKSMRKAIVDYILQVWKIS